MDPFIKRRYNITYTLRQNGFKINSKRKEISIYFREIPKIIDNRHIIELVKTYSYSLVENRQLELNL